SPAGSNAVGLQLAPEFVLTQMPPPALPAQIRPGCVGSRRTARVRPPIVLGPSQLHVSGATILIGSTIAPVGIPATRLLPLFLSSSLSYSYALRSASGGGSVPLSPSSARRPSMARSAGLSTSRRSLRDLCPGPEIPR